MNAKHSMKTHNTTSKRENQNEQKWNKSTIFYSFLFFFKSHLLKNLLMHQQYDFISDFPEETLSEGKNHQLIGRKKIRFAVRHTAFASRCVSGIDLAGSSYLCVGTGLFVQVTLCWRHCQWYQPWWGCSGHRACSAPSSSSHQNSFPLTWGEHELDGVVLGACTDINIMSSDSGGILMSSVDRNVICNHEQLMSSAKMDIYITSRG